MRKVLLYSLLLVAGLVLSQLLPGWLGAAYPGWALYIRLGTMLCLAFIMIHVGYEFDIDRSNLRPYAVDYGVAATAAAFPWILVCLYFVFIMAPAPMWSSGALWKESLLEARFAAPTSAGVLFSMLVAAGLASTWVFKKARILAIFDDLDTVLLMIPLKALMVGLRWQLGVIVLIMLAQLALAWRYLHRLRLPITWPWVLLYAAVIAAGSEAAYQGSKLVDDVVPIHIEVLLPAFVLGCMLARPRGVDAHAHDAVEGHEAGLETPSEQRVATVVSAAFMLLVGLSMPAVLAAPEAVPSAAAAQVAGPGALVETPPYDHTSEVFGTAPAGKYPGIAPEVVAAKEAFPGWGIIALHVLAVTFISNLGKMFPVFCYRREAPWRHRLAVAVAMFPRGEVGAGVLVLSISYGIGGPALTVAMLSLALNLLATGLFILIVRRLIGAQALAAPHA